MSFSLEIKKRWLKFRLKREYLELRKMLDNYSCGYALASEINPSVARQGARVDGLTRELLKTDPVFKKLMEGNQ